MSPLSLSALSTSSIGGVIGTDGLQSSSTSLVQYAGAFPASSLISTLLVVGTSAPLLQYGEEVAATPSGPQAVEPQTTDVEAPRLDTDSTPSHGTEDRISPPVGDVPGVRATTPSPTSRPTDSHKAVSIPPPGAAGTELLVSAAESIDRSSRAGGDLVRPEWKRARAYLLAFTGLALGAYVRCRGLGHRGERRGETRKLATPGATPRPHLQGVRMGRVEA